MPYVVRKNRVTGKLGLVFEAASLPRGKIGKKGSDHRSVLLVNGERYHATKGYKTRAYWQ